MSLGKEQTLVEKEVLKVHLLQADHTSHVKGMMYALEKMTAVKELASLLEYEVAGKNEFKQLKSCFQLVRHDNSNLGKAGAIV
jgi:hypothetical protein